MDNWISVKNELPMIGRAILTYRESKMYGNLIRVGKCVFIDSDGAIFTEMDSKQEIAITHWQPLPAPPVDER